MKRIVLVSLSMLAIGCTSNAQRIDSLARSAGLERRVVETDQLRSLIYMNRHRAEDGRLIVFLDGDGQPWRAGVVPNDDPTTANPMALELMIHTPSPSAYVARPCYQQVASEGCSPAMWTSARYSDAIVNAMARAVSEAASWVSAEEVVLVGYSGGGVLAVLIGERLEAVVGVVTIAANLDIDAWTAHHKYLPLSESLNPVISDREHPWPEVHLSGQNDTVVPSATTDAYFKRYPSAQRWILEEHGHKCCWVANWKELWEKVEGTIHASY